MKNEQQEKAKEFYFDTNMSKSEIAEQLGVNRRTIMLWCQQGNWEQLRRSARHMPALIAEKCYYLIDQYTTQLLTVGNTITSRSHLHADAINKLASAIKKIKTRSTVNESMEMFNFFLEGLRRRDAALADQVKPSLEDYIEDRRGVETTDFLLSDFDEDGTIPIPEKELNESLLDYKEELAFREEVRKAATEEEALENWLNHKPASENPSTPGSQTGNPVPPHLN